MKGLIKKYIIALFVSILVLTTNSYGVLIKGYTFSNVMLNSTNMYGACKIYNNNDILYYKKNLTTGTYADKVTLEELHIIRNEIKSKLNSLNIGEYLVSKILKDDSCYNQEYKEFCYKREASSLNTDLLTKVVILGYDDEYQFRSGITSNKGAYKVRKIGETEEFYVSYDDSWVEAELFIGCDATKINLEKTSVQIKVGETIEIKYSVLPDNALSKSVTISYSNGIRIDTTESGVVKITGVSVGDEHIIIKLKNNNNISSKCDIKVVSDSQQIPSNEGIASDNYKIENKYISRVKANTKINDFKNNITSSTQYSIYDSNGNRITSDDVIMTTGMRIKFNNDEYQVVVKGDVDGNGKISITDLVKLNLYNVHIKTPSELEKIAADINEDGKISITDLVLLKLAVVNIKSI